MVKAQEYFNNKKKDVVELIANNKNLEGSLKLENFTKLEKLYCPTNKITRLEIVNCPKLRTITYRDNQLVELCLGKLKELTELYCEGNQLKELDISNCPNLKKLACSNNLLSSLNLKELTKLEYLDISDTNLDTSILVHSPESLERIICLNKKNRKCQGIIKELKNYCEDSVKGIYNLKKWKAENSQLIEEAKEQSKRQELLNSESSSPAQILQSIRQKLEIYFPGQSLSISELVEKMEEKINNLKQQITDLQKQLETQNETHQQLAEQNVINFQTQITQLQNEKINFNNQINTSQEEIQKLSREIKELTTQNHVLESSLNSLKQISQEEKNTLNQQINSLENAKITTEKEFNQKINELKQEIEGLTANLIKGKNEWEKEKLIHQQTQIKLDNLRSGETDKEKQLKTQITTLQAKNSNLTLTAEKNSKIFNGQLQDLQKIIQEQKNVELTYQQRINKLTEKIKQLDQTNQKEVPISQETSQQPVLLQKEREELEVKLQKAVASYQEIKDELRKKEECLSYLISFGSERSTERNELRQEISDLKKKLTQAKQTKNVIEKQLAETKEKLVESKGKLAAKQEEIIRMDEQLKNAAQVSSSPNQKENKLIAYAKKLQTIQEELDLFFNEWNELPLDQQEKLIAGLETTKKDVRTKWVNENSVFALTNRVNKAVTFIGGGLSTLGSPEIGGGITLVSSAIDAVVLEIEISKKKEQEKLIEFLQDFANLEKNYQSLKKISADLILINENSSLSGEINETLIIFSQLVNRLQEDLNLYNSNISNAEQGANKARNKHFIQHLRENHAEINKVLVELKESLNRSNTERFEAWIVVPTENTPLLPQ